MTEIHKDTEQNGPFPRPEEDVVYTYFTGGGRGEILSQMKQGLEQGIALLVLTGDEGSGKTALCRQFEQDVPEGCVTVYFSRPVDSFDDVLKTIAQRLGLSPDDVTAGRSRDGKLQEIASLLHQQSKDLLVIFDEAENLYLATLERIRKMLDRVSALGGRMHILFSGRNNFNENYDQLSICDFHRSDELYFSLRPLTEEETGQCLRQAENKSAGGEDGTVFTDELIAEIFYHSQGNLKKINDFAQHSSVDKDGDISFMVLLESVAEEVGPTAARLKTEGIVEKLTIIKEGVVRGAGRGRRICCELFQRSRQLLPLLSEHKDRLGGLMNTHRGVLPYLGSGLCVLLLLLVFIATGDDKENVEGGSREKIVHDVPVVVMQKDPERFQPDEAVMVAEKPAPQAATVTPVVAVRALQEASSQQVVRHVADTAVEDEVAGEEEIFAPKPESPETMDIQPVVIVEEQRSQPPKVISPVKAIPPVEKKKIVVLRPSDSQKRKPPATSTGGRHTITVQSRKEVVKVIPTTSQYGAKQLLKKRLHAGSIWHQGNKEDYYTVQLMVLGSKSAERNLVRMLSEDRYRQEAGNFYIFKKKTAPENIFVFYGEYSSADMARLAQNSLPQFLRVHKPYAISIKGAVAKVR